MAAKTAAAKPARIVNKNSWSFDFKKNWAVYVLFIPVLVYEIVLHYIPMFGIIMAFEDYNVMDGYFGSPWVGFKNFIDLFTGEEFLTALRNTVAIAIIKGTLGFIAPILFALFLSLLHHKVFKRTVQTMSYLPNFVAAVVVASLFLQFLDKDGPLTLLLTHAVHTRLSRNPTTTPAGRPVRSSKPPLKVRPPLPAPHRTPSISMILMEIW